MYRVRPRVVPRQNCCTAIVAPAIHSAGHGERDDRRMNPSQLTLLNVRLRRIGMRMHAKGKRRVVLNMVAS